MKFGNKMLLDLFGVTPQFNKEFTNLGDRNETIHEKSSHISPTCGGCESN